MYHLLNYSPQHHLHFALQRRRATAAHLLSACFRMQSEGSAAVHL